MERVKFDILGKLQSERGNSDGLTLVVGTIVIVLGVGTLFHLLTIESDLDDIKNKVDENSLAPTPVTRDITSFQNSFNSDIQLTPTPQP